MYQTVILLTTIEIVAANSKVKNYKVTPEGIYLIDYRTTIER